MVLQSLPLNGVLCYNTADSIYSLRWTAFFFPYVYLWVYVCRHMCMWRLKNSLWESLIPCHHMGLKDHTWCQTRLQLSHLLTHLTGSKTVFSNSQWHCFEHPCIRFLVRHPRTFSGMIGITGFESAVTGSHSASWVPCTFSCCLVVLLVPFPGTCPMSSHSCFVDSKVVVEGADRAWQLS